MGEGGGEEEFLSFSSLPFSLPSFPFSPEKPDTQANESAIFKISSALFILGIYSKSTPIHIVCVKEKLFSPHTPDSSTITDLECLLPKRY